jgi:DNA-binding transcriptional MerR regulator
MEMPNRKYHLDERATYLLKEHYDSQPETIDRLCRTLGVPRHTLKHWAQVLGLARTANRLKPWTDQEVSYLESQYHRTHVDTIARKLGRSTTAVAQKAKRLGIRKCGEGYTLHSLALAMGVDDHKVALWIDRGLLPASRRQTDRDRDVYFISEKAAREFIVEHPLEIDLRRADGLGLIDLLANGAAPSTSSGPALSQSNRGES